MSWWGVTLLVVGVLPLAWLTLLCVGRARRLDRLHVRTDAARAGLAAALERRAGVALRIASPGGPEVGPAAGRDPALRAPAPRAPALRAAAAEGVAADREAAENRLSRWLGALDRTGLPAGLGTELADAEQLVVLARHVYNDAVRDTLGLRSRRLVRWLRLAGTAPVPVYFEIADPPFDGPQRLPVPAAVTPPL